MFKSDCFVVVPAHNEVETIGKIVKEIKCLEYKNVIVVDDGSDDETFLVSKKAGADVLRHIVNCGQGAAVKTGLEYAKKCGATYAIIIDGDGQFLPDDIVLLQKRMLETNADIILGSRFSSYNRIPLIKRVYNMIANVISYFLSGILLTDSQTGFRLLGTRALHVLDLTADGYGFCTEMIRLANYHRLSIRETPVRVMYFGSKRRHRGQNFATGVETLFRLMRESFFR